MAHSKPVSAREIAQRSSEHAFYIENLLCKNLIEVTNTGIREQVAHGKLHYECHVPTFVYGFPVFDTAYVARRLRDIYQTEGFRVAGDGTRLRIEWDRGPSPRAST